MSEYLSSAEEKEKILEWWKDNGRFIVSGVGLGLIGIFAWRGWNAHLDNQAGAASVVFDDLVAASVDANQDELSQKFATLKSQYGKTAYVSQAHLLMAKEAVGTGQLDEAAVQLNQAIATSNDKELIELANFRLAKVHFSSKDFDQALAALQRVESKSYVPLVEEMRGDIYRAQGEISKARIAYTAAQEAMQEIPIGDPNLLQMKLSDLGISEE